MDLIELLGGFLLGLTLAAPPGPVNTLIARQAALHGWAAGVRAGIAAPVLDSVYLVLFVFALPAAVPLDPVKPYLAIVGAALLLYLAIATVRPRSDGNHAPGMGAVILVTLTNPFQYAWWLAAGTTRLAHDPAAAVPGFLLAIFGWVAVFSHLVARGARRWDWFEPLVTIACADLLFVFALQTAWAGLLGI